MYVKLIEISHETQIKWLYVLENEEEEYKKYNSVSFMKVISRPTNIMVGPATMK